MRNLVQNLFPNLGKEPQNPTPNDHHSFTSAPPEANQEELIKIPGAILNLIDEHYSVELACGDLSVVRLRQGDSVVSVLAQVGDEIQWPLATDEVAVKLDDSHYFFSFRAPKEHGCGSDSSDEEENGDRNDSDDFLNYGLTIASKGQEDLVRKLAGIFQNYSSFSVQKVSENGMFKKGEALDGSVAKETSPADLKSEKKKKELMIEERCAAYWTTLAPNVEDYSWKSARLIAAGSGKLIKGILWCGDVTVERLKWGNEVMKKRVSPGSKTEIDPKTFTRIRRVKRVTKMTQKVADGVLSEVVKVSEFFTSSVVNSKVGKKFFSLLPGQIVLASLDGFRRGKKQVRQQEKGLMLLAMLLALHGLLLRSRKLLLRSRKTFKPNSVVKPTTLAQSAAKTAAAEVKAKKKS